MKKKNTFLTVALLLAVVVLGVGYAASTGPWVVQGNATAKGSELDVDFTDATGDGSPSISSDTLGIMNVELTEIGTSATATFTITNNSKAGIKATINEDDITITYGDEELTSSEYFIVTKELAGTELEAGQSTTLDVTVELKKVGLSDVTEPFKVSINDISASSY